MAMNYKPSMTKAELLEIATANGVQADDSMTKTAILAALDGAGQAGDRGTEDTAGQETPAEDAQEAPEGVQPVCLCRAVPPTRETERTRRIQRYVRGRESLPCGRDRGLSLVARMIVPVERLSAFHVKVKTPGNLAHKYYNDIVSTMRETRRYNKWQSISTGFRRGRLTRRFRPLLRQIPGLRSS